MNDKKLVKFLFVLLLLPLTLAMCSGDRYRYACQDPENWDKDMCKLPLCDVSRTCPEHIFKGQRDPRIGPPKDDIKPQATPVPTPAASSQQGATCAK